MHIISKKMYACSQYQNNYLDSFINYFELNYSNLRVNKKKKYEKLQLDNSVILNDKTFFFFNKVHTACI